MTKDRLIDDFWSRVIIGVTVAFGAGVAALVSASIAIDIYDSLIK